MVLKQPLHHPMSMPCCCRPSCAQSSQLPHDHALHPPEAGCHPWDQQSLLHQHPTRHGWRKMTENQNAISARFPPSTCCTISELLASSLKPRLGKSLQSTWGSEVSLVLKLAERNGNPPAWSLLKLSSNHRYETVNCWTELGFDRSASRVWARTSMANKWELPRDMTKETLWQTVLRPTDFYVLWGPTTIDVASCSTPWIARLPSCARIPGVAILRFQWANGQLLGLESKISGVQMLNLHSYDWERQDRPILMKTNAFLNAHWVWNENPTCQHPTGIYLVDPSIWKPGSFGVCNGSSGQSLGLESKISGVQMLNLHSYDWERQDRPILMKTNAFLNAHWVWNENPTCQHPTGIYLIDPSIWKPGSFGVCNGSSGQSLGLESKISSVQMLNLHSYG